MGIQYVRDSGVAPGANGVTDKPSLARTNLAMRNVGTAAVVLRVTDFQGATSEPITIGVGQPFRIDDCSLLQYNLTGNGGLLIMYGSYPEKIDPSLIAIQSGEVSPNASVPTTSVLYVQTQAALGNSVKKTQSGGSSTNLPALSVTSGQLILVCVQLTAGSNPGASVTDSQGNTYTALTEGTGAPVSPGNYLGIFQATAGTTGSDTITVNFTGSSLGQGSAVAFGATNAIDNVGDVGRSGTSTCLTTSPGDQVICATYGAQPSGFTEIQSESPYLTVGSMFTLGTGPVTASTTGLSVLFSIAGALLPALADVNGTIKVDSGGGAGTELNSGYTLDAIPFVVALTAAGDLVYNNGTDWVNLPIGTAGQYLKVVGGEPAWATLAAIPGPATTVDGPDSFGDSSSVGTDTTYAREDHKHGLPNSGVLLAPVTPKSSGSPYSVAATDEVILVTTGGSGYTVNLPAASTAGRKVLIIKADSGAGAVTVSRAGSDTIEGATSKTVSSQYGKVGLVSDGTSTWYDLGSGGV